MWQIFLTKEFYIAYKSILGMIIVSLSDLRSLQLLNYDTVVPDGRFTAKFRKLSLKWRWVENGYDKGMLWNKMQFLYNEVDYIKGGWKWFVRKVGCEGSLGQEALEIEVRQWLHFILIVLFFQSKDFKIKGSAL